MEENARLKRCPLVLLVGYLTFTKAHEQIKCAILPDIIPWDFMEELWFSCVTHTDPYGSLSCQISVRVEDSCTHPAGTSNYFLKTLSLTESFSSELIPILMPGTQAPQTLNFCLKINHPEASLPLDEPTLLIRLCKLHHHLFLLFLTNKEFYSFGNCSKINRTDK